VLALHLAEPGKGGLDAQLFHVGRVHGAHERLDQPVKGLATQPAADERGHALIGLVQPRGDEVLQRRPKFTQRA